MTPRRQRMLIVAVIVGGVAIAAAFAARAFRENLMMFYAPSQIANGEAPVGHPFRLGGLVTIGSVEREPGKLDVSFVLTDLKHEITVSYAGILPDLFREGQGIIAHGTLGADGVFHADEVLAKHDESYTPPEVEQALKTAREDPRAEQQ
jgi:cytochrome c-type biogenesis protein CcmE